MTAREAAQRPQPILSRFSVATIIRTFREENRFYVFVIESSLHIYTVKEGKSITVLCL